MLQIKAPDPTSLWMRLAEIAIGPSTVWQDYQSGSKAVTYSNTLQVNEWHDRYDALGLFWAVGYELYGNKMTRLMNHYLDEDQWSLFKKEWKRYRDKRAFSLGMQFKRVPAGAGGCLGSFEVCKDPGQTRVFLHSKIAEFPKKFTADMRLVGYLMRELGIPKAHVTWYISAIWTTSHSLKGVVPVLGWDEVSKKMGRSDGPRDLMKIHTGYLEPTQRRVVNHYNSLGIVEKKEGMRLNPMTGEHVKIRA